MAKTNAEDSKLNDGVRILVIKKSKKSKNKRSQGTREIERGLRRSVDSQATTLSTYVKRHRKSNSKKKDGWIRDMPINLIKAQKKGQKKLKPMKIMGM